jgi:hypothetical protein
MRRRQASYRIRPDYKAAVAVLAQDNQSSVGEAVEGALEKELLLRYGANWRDVIRVRFNDDGGIIVDPIEEE